ncbi:MAG: phenylalanine--tRNA ligase subunit beta [Patescibacteria group bacterium]|nr:phenylalanine--tRNA ligase subunit beta [Patescibacteria group bacterium]
MTFSYNWLQSFFKKQLPEPKKLAEALTMHSFQVEEVIKTGKDWLLDIDILPNRGPDCFSHLGIAREISAVLNIKLQFGGSKLKEQEQKAKDLIEVKVNDKNDCLRYTVRVIDGVKVGYSPKWIRDRLRVLGLKSINNVVDIANYVMLETGQPLHAFDRAKISKQKITVRRAEKGERIITLDNERYSLDKDILIIADEKGPLAIAGIKGGKKAQIDKKTKTIVLESANFDPAVIRSGSKKIDLKTDASWRFEHGLDLDLTESAIDRAAYLIEELTGGKTYQGLIDFYPKKALPKKIKLYLGYVRSLLGVEISDSKINRILERLDFGIKKMKSGYIMVEVPTYRLDISIPEDLIEEIGRVYGYHKIHSVFPVSAIIPPEKNIDIFWEDMTKSILKEAGFTEVYSNSFINRNQAKIFNHSASNLIEVINPTSADYQYLRPSLIPNLLNNLKRNQKLFKDIKIFESGKIFKKEKTKEKKALTGVISGDAFYMAKGIVDLLLNKLGISGIWYDQYQPTPEESEISIWHSKKLAEIKVDQEEIGFLGEISSKITDQLKLEPKVVVFDFDFEKVLKLVSEEKEYRPISPYPSAVRDIAILVPRQVSVEQILNKIERLGGMLIKDIDLFDIYDGEELPEGKKNLAFHIIYQAEDRTLSSEEIDKVQNKIVKALEKESGWEIRK